MLQLSEKGLLARAVSPDVVKVVEAMTRWAPIVQVETSLSQKDLDDAVHFIEINNPVEKDDLVRYACAEAIAGTRTAVVELATRPGNWQFADGKPGNRVNETKLVVVNSNPARSAIVGAEAERLELVESSPSVREIQDRAPQIFPKLEFSDSFWNSANGSSSNVAVHRADFIHALGTLNDEGAEIFDDPKGHSSIVASLRKRGITASGESGGTKSGKPFRKERTACFKDIGEIVCNWHIKFYNPSLRVHFDVRGGKVYVGAATDHFRTAGKP